LGGGGGGALEKAQPMARRFGSPRAARLLACTATGRRVSRFALAAWRGPPCPFLSRLANTRPRTAERETCRGRDRPRFNSTCAFSTVSGSPEASKTAKTLVANCGYGKIQRYGAIKSQEPKSPGRPKEHTDEFCDRRAEARRHYEPRTGNPPGARRSTRTCSGSACARSTRRCRTIPSAT